MSTSQARPRPRARTRAARAASAVLVALLIVAAPAAVFAHAELVTSTPADRSSVDGTPTLVELRFSEPLSSKSSIELVGPGGSVATGGPAAGDPMTLSLVPPGLEPGLYSVRWAAATDDGHIERGAITFTVTEPPPTLTPSPPPPPSDTAGSTPTPLPGATTEAPSPSPTAVPTTPPPGPPASGEGPDLSVILAVVAVAIILGFATRMLLRGRDAA